MRLVGNLVSVLLGGSLLGGSLLGGSLVVASAEAQAPRITDKGDPSVKNDTIYALAVDSTKYPEQSVVLLLDDGVMQIEADGRGATTWRQVVQVLRQQAVASYQERRFTYDPDRQKLHINWIRVLKPNGEIISDKPSQIQESDVPASMINPVYVRRKVIRTSLTGVAPGTIVDMSWTVETDKTYRPGDRFQSWRVTAGTTVRRSRFLVDVPDDLDLKISEHNLNFTRHETTADHRKTYVWATSDVAWVKPELYAPPADSNDLGMYVAVSTPATWSDVGKWYAELAHDRFKPTPAVIDSVRRVVAKSTTRQDSILALHRWVSQDVRYVSLSLGIGGYQPRAPEAVLSTGFGDCKDKATLLITALGVIGVPAYPVLLGAGYSPDRQLPTIGAFNHEIVAIPQASGYQYVDPTSDVSPFGTLPPADASEFALVVHPDGVTEEVTTTPDPAGANLLHSSAIGTLDSSGAFSGRIEIDATGIGALGLRAMMKIQMDSTQRAAFLRNAAAGMFPSAKGDSLVTFDGKDLSATPRISFTIVAPQATQRSGSTDILPMASSTTRLGQLADELQSRMPRHMPIDAAKVLGPLTTVSESRMTLPEGWHARLPNNVSATSVFGTYTATYRQDGRVLIVEHRTSGTRGIYSKDHIDELIAWYRAMAADRVPFIVIDRKGP
jgi:transglutaminase-like putative cysteine protease